MTNDHKIRNYSEVLEKNYGIAGSPQRMQFDEEAYSFYVGQTLMEARKNAGLTQSKLAERIGADKSYISRIENGFTVPSVATFYRVANAMGLNVSLTPA